MGKNVMASSSLDATRRGGAIGTTTTKELAVDCFMRGPASWHVPAPDASSSTSRRAAGASEALGLALLDGEGYVAAKSGDYARALASGVTVVPLLLETFGGFSPEVVSTLREAAEWRKNKLASSEYDETTWAARTWTSFVSQRISVVAQLAMAQEAAKALGLSVAADPRGQ